MAHFPKGVGGGGGSWVNFCWACIIVYSGANIIIDPILVTFGQICNFHNPNSVTFYFYELTHGERFPFHFHLQYKHILVRLLTINKKNSLTPKIPKMCDPILVTLENVTSGTSPLASYKAVTPPPPTHGSFFIISTCFKYRSITYNTKIFFFPFAGC